MNSRRFGAFLRPVRTPPSPAPFWYHVTYNGRLPSIAEHGLRRGQARSIGAPAHDWNAARGVFLTDAGGVSFWHGRAEAFAEHNSDNVVEDEMIPVVLRIHPRAVTGIEEDEVGTDDARARAVVFSGVISPRSIRVFDGKGWIPVSDYDSVDAMQGVDTRIEEWDEGPEEMHYFKHSSPLMPTEFKDTSAWDRSGLRW